MKQQKTKPFAASPPRRAMGASADGAAGIIDLVAMRQVNDFLAVKGCWSSGSTTCIGQDIVQPGRADGAGIAQITHLHRTGAVRQDAGPRSFGMAFEVDRDVDLTCPAASCATSASLLCRTSSKRSKALISRARMALPSSRPKEMAVISKRARSWRSIRPGDQFGGGMLVEIRRQIGDADAVMAIALAFPQRRAPAAARGRQQKSRCSAAAARRHRRKEGRSSGAITALPVTHRRDHLRLAVLPARQIAAAQHRAGQCRPAHKDGPAPRLRAFSKAAKASS